MADPLVIKISDPQEVDIIAFRGDYGGFRISVTEPEPDLTPIDISEAEWDGDIRTLKNDVEVLAMFEFTPVVGQLHMVDVVLPYLEARKLGKKQFYDIEMTLNDQPHTLIWGKVLAGEDVSRP